ncbi:uncharacterized protein LOC124283605 [Haliotis rubra]|uniref:uncharacterized protein LOC124283605 n=1 Tax=Haliotis rubra TaxID=36100 RepID=UPI001EE56A70|nr:uncharacterized protein LOC124283605 [Haliotis rubra]
MAPKCKRTHWRNPRMTKGVFTADIPWGMKENSSLSLTGLTTQGRFTIVLGDAKPSSPENIEQTFLFHLDAQVSETKLNYSFRKGSMEDVPMEQSWNTNTSVPFRLDIHIMKGDFEFCIMKGNIQQCTNQKNMMNVADVKAFSIFKDFMIESIALHLD